MCLLCYKVRNFSNKLEREGAICECVYCVIKLGILVIN